MIYIYNCFGGTHSSSIASAVHLRKVPLDRVPTKEEILNIDYFNKLSYKDAGRLICRGTDDEGNKVFTVGRGRSKTLVPSLENLINVIHDECGFNDKIIFSNMSPCVPPAMTMGGFFSRGLHIHFIGVPLLAIGARQTFFDIVKVVNLTKERAKTVNCAVTVFRNDDIVNRRLFR